MTIYVNLTRNELMVSADVKTALGRLDLHQNDKGILAIVFLEETGNEADPIEVVEIPDGFTSISFGGRPKTNLADDGLLFSAVDFVAVGTDDDLRYEQVLDLNTAAIDGEFPEDQPTKASIDVLTDVELRNVDATRRQTVIRQWPSRVLRDIFRGDEGVPVDGDPVYPAPSSLLTTGTDTASIKRGSKAVAVDDEVIVVAYGTPFSAPPTTILLSPIVKTNTGDADPPIIYALQSITAANFSVKLSAPAPAAASFRWVAIL